MAEALAEAEDHCSTTIREAESNGTSRACSTQQFHAKDIQCLEAEAIEEKGRDHLTFLTTCSADLRVSPPDSHGIMVTPYHLLLGSAPMSTLLSIPPGVFCPEWESAPWTPPSTAPAATRPLPQSKWWYHLPDLVGPPSPSEATSKVTPKEPLCKTLSRSHQEAFNRDSRLIQKAREDYFQRTSHTSKMRIPPI